MRPISSALLALQSALLIFATNEALHARGGESSKVIVPFIDYEGIAAAAREAVANAQAGAITDGHGGHRPPKCKEVRKRKEWRQLTTAQKKAYIKATKCLTTKPDYGISTVSDKFVPPIENRFRHILTIFLRLYDAFTAVNISILFPFLT